MREIMLIDDLLMPLKNPQSSGQIVERDEYGRFLEGHGKLGGVKKGWKSPKKRLAEMWMEVPSGNTRTRGEALLVTMWNMAIGKENEAMIKLILAYLDGLPRQPIDFSGEVEHVHTTDEKFQEGLQKILQVFENLKKPRKTFKYEEAVVAQDKKKPEKSISKEIKNNEPKHPGIGTIYIPPDPQ